MRRRRPGDPRGDPWYVTVLTYTGVLLVLLGVGWCGHVLGISRASQADIRDLQRQIEERCR